MHIPSFEEFNSINESFRSNILNQLSKEHGGLDNMFNGAKWGFSYIEDADIEKIIQPSEAGDVAGDLVFADGTKVILTEDGRSKLRVNNAEDMWTHYSRNSMRDGYNKKSILDRPEDKPMMDYINNFNKNRDIDIYKSHKNALKNGGY